MFSLGYISFISMLHMVYKSIDKNYLIAIVFFIGASCTLFVLNEIWKMKLDAEYVKSTHKNWESFLNNQVDLMGLEKINIDKNIEIYKVYRKIYPFFFWLNSITGFIAVFIFLFKLFNILISF